MRRGTILIVSAAVIGAAAWLSAQAPAPSGDVELSGPSDVPVTFDGHVSKFEYGDAATVRFGNGHGVVDARVKAADGYLYFAFEIPDRSPHVGDDIVIMLDGRADGGDAPQTDDIRAYVRRKGENSRMEQGDGKQWVNLYGDWEYRSTAYAIGWEVEARIPLKSLSADFAKTRTMGLALRIWDNDPQKTWHWPAESDEGKPSTWGKLVLSGAKK